MKIKHGKKLFHLLLLVTGLAGLPLLSVASPPSMDFLDGYASDAQSRFYVRVLKDAANDFRAMGGEPLSEEEKDERMADYILEKSIYIKSVAKTMTPQKAEQSWLKSIESMKKNLPRVRKVSPPAGAYRADRFVPEESPSSVPGSKIRSRNVHFNVVYEFKDRDSYNERYGSLKAMFLHFFNGQPGWKIHRYNKEGTESKTYSFSWSGKSGNPYLKDFVMVTVMSVKRANKALPLVMVTMMKLEFKESR
jgi:hypothetical protein